MLFKIGNKKKKSNPTQGEKKKSLSFFSNLLISYLSKYSVKQEEILGVDLNSKYIHLSQLSRKNEDDQWILERLSYREINESEARNDVLEDAEFYAKELRVAFENSKASTKNVAIAIPVSSAIIKVVTSPLMEDYELDKAVETDTLWENLVQIAEDLKEYSIFHQIIHRNIKENTMDILFVASKISDLESYMEIVRKANLNPVIVDVKCFALKNALDLGLRNLERTNVILKFSLDENYLMIIRDNIPIVTDIFLRPNEVQKLSNPDSDLSEIEEIIRRYALQVRQAINNFEGKYQEFIKNVYLISSIPNITKIGDYLQSNLPNLTISLLNPLKNIRVPEQFKSKIELNNKSIFTTTLGLASRKLDVFGYYKFVTAVKNINLLPNRESIKRSAKSKAKISFAFKMVFLITLFVYSIIGGYAYLQKKQFTKQLFNFNDIEVERNSLNEKLNTLQNQIYKINKEIEISLNVKSNQKQSYDLLVAIVNSTPERVLFENISFSDAGETILEGVAYSDSDILIFVQNLNDQNQIIEKASLNSMTTSSKYEGRKSFFITIQYKKEIL